MKIAVIDTCFSLNQQSSKGVPARFVEWQLKKYGFELSDINHSDYIFLTVIHPQSFEYVNKIKLKYKQPVIVGGVGALSPYVFKDCADFIVLGDGENVISQMAKTGLNNVESLDNVWNKNKNIVSINQIFDFSAPAIQSESGDYIVWAGRGCKHKCLFCQTAWAYQYQESDLKIIQKTKRLLSENKSINFMSNDLSQHRFFQQLPYSSAQSFSVGFLKKTKIVPKSRQIRLGIEGVSQRLRTFVNKPISTQDLIDCTIFLNRNGKAVRWFMIAGLPTETREDWLELRDAIKIWKRNCVKGVLELSFTAWCPDPATPLSIMPISDDYWHNFEEFKKWFFEGIGFSNRIKLYNPQQPKSRLIKAQSSMGLTENELYQGGFLFGRNDFVEYPFKQSAIKISKRMKDAYGIEGIRI